MNIEIKKSQNPVKYEDALELMERRLLEIDQNKSNDLIYILFIVRRIMHQKITPRITVVANSNEITI